MFRSRRAKGACLALFVLAFVPSHALATWPTDPSTNLTVCNAAGDQKNPTLLPDGAGGAFITWWDNRSGDPDVHLQRVDFAGVPKWTANGIALTNAPGAQFAPGLVTDGAGGCIVAWADSSLGANNARLFAQRVDAAGGVRWAPGGIRVCPVESGQSTRAFLEDGAGGAFFLWSDNRGGNYDIYAQRLDANGTPLWNPNGVALCTAPGDQLFYSSVPQRIVSDGAGGFITAWYDQRAGAGNDDIYAQRVSASGTPQWTADGVALCTATGEQQNPVVCSNGLGGAIVAWRDTRGGVYRVYLQQVSAGGTTLWAANGIQASTNGVAQTDPRLVSDGANGVILVWLDNRSSFDFYAQRLDNSGAPLWSPSDVALVTNPASQFGAEIASDGAGGAVVAWRDERSGSTNADVYAQRVNTSGAVLWGTDGVAISTAAGNMPTVRMTSDATGGAIIAWGENRGGAMDLYAQRVSGDGTLGGREPHIATVQDLGPDQGGRVRVLWDRSDLDVGAPPTGIESYTLWRRVIMSAARQAIAAGARVIASPGAARSAGEHVLLRVVSDGGEATYWEYLVAVPAIGETGYGYTVATTADSMAGLVPWNVFRVMAETPAGQWYSSAVDSGYSVDNLPPSAPAPFTAALVSGSTALHWGAGVDADLVGYRLYRGFTADFVPGPGNLIIAKADTGYLDAGQAGRDYKLSAVDVHGNESAFAIVTPPGTADVPGAAALSFALDAIRPNPLRGRQLTVDFVLDRPGAAKLEFVDVTGRRVLQREVGSLGIGRHRVDFTPEARLRPGLYLVRLTQGTKVRVRRAVIVE
jgi:hypothetical protein